MNLNSLFRAQNLNNIANDKKGIAVFLNSKNRGNLNSSQRLPSQCDIVNKNKISQVNEYPTV